MKVYVVIQNGIVIDMFAKNETVEAEVVDLDVGDSYEEHEEIEKRYDELIERVNRGELTRL